MANFFTDNDDIRQYFDFLDVGLVASEMEDGFTYAAEFEQAPANAEEAIAKYPADSRQAGRRLRRAHRSHRARDG